MNWVYFLYIITVLTICTSTVGWMTYWLSNKISDQTTKGSESHKKSLKSSYTSRKVAIYSGVPGLILLIVSISFYVYEKSNSKN
jgi:hypothetical protein